jgi:hypothetical protein
MAQDPRDKRKNTLFCVGSLNPIVLKLRCAHQRPRAVPRYAGHIHSVLNNCHVGGGPTHSHVVPSIRWHVLIEYAPRELL